jgi:hypothetical protein
MGLLTLTSSLTRNLEQIHYTAKKACADPDPPAVPRGFRRPVSPAFVSNRRPAFWLNYGMTP